MRRSILFASASAALAVASLLAVPGVAHAADPAPTASAPTTASAATTNEKPKAKLEEEDEFRPVALTANPLSLILGRIGVNVEYLPWKHHAIVLNPYFQSTSAGDDTLKTSYTNFGAELGYHFYTGSRGANGFFVGPSLLFVKSNASTSATSNGQTTTSSDSILAYGAALDLGGQHVTKGGFTIGGGIGAMYLTSAASNVKTSSTVTFNGVLPRFLLTVGYSF